MALRWVGNREFTGKERDAETGLDYFGTRYVSSAQGRWTSPDWSEKPQPVPYADLTDPQSLNLYAYVRNKPLRHVDLDGPQELVSDTLVAEGLTWLTGAAATYFWGKLVVYIADKVTQAKQQGLQTPIANEETQGRDAQGKFLPKQPGQAQPGADAEKDALAAEGATKTGTALPGTDRRVDGGTVTATGQKIEVKSGTSVSNTDQLKQTGQASNDATGQPLLVVTTNPNVKVTAPTQNNPNLQIRPVRTPPQQ